MKAAKHRSRPVLGKRADTGISMICAQHPERALRSD
jgi:hypothetical protein